MILNTVYHLDTWTPLDDVGVSALLLESENMVQDAENVSSQATILVLECSNLSSGSLASQALTTPLSLGTTVEHAKN